jgi:hypothetical protein
MANKCIMTSFHKCYILKVNITIQYETSTFFELKGIDSGTRFVSLAATYTTCTPQPLHSEYYPWLYNSTV